MPVTVIFSKVASFLETPHYICVQLRSWVQKVLHIPIKIKVVVFDFKLYKYIV